MNLSSCVNVTAPRELSIFTSTISVPISLISTVANALIIFVVIRDPLKQLHSPFNYFLVNLACCDLLVGLVTAPMSVYLHAIETIVQWDKTTSVVFQLSYMISVIASIFSIIALTVDRYIAITYPIDYRIRLSWPRCVIISIIIWMLSVAIPLIRFKVGYIFCLMALINSAVIIAFVALCFTYVRLSVFLRIQTKKSNKQMDVTPTASEEIRLKRMVIEQKMTRVFQLILILFCCTYLFGTVVIYVIHFCVTCNCILMHVLRELQFVLILANSCMNPFVSILKLGKIRKSIIAMVCCKRKLSKVIDDFHGVKGRSNIALELDIEIPDNL